MLAVCVNGQHLSGSCPPVSVQSSEEKADADLFNTPGVELTKKGDVEGALEIFREATARFPNDAVSWNNVGVILSAKLGKHKESLHYFERAICLDPKFAFAFYSLGTAYLKLSEYGLSESHLAQAIELQPGYVEALNNLGSVYLRTGRFKQAEKLFEQMHKERPDDFFAANNLAAAFFYNKKFKQAENIYRRLIGAEPDRQVLHFNLAAALLRRGERSEAIRIYSFLNNQSSPFAQELYNGLFAGKIINLNPIDK